jgi:serine protease Do
MSTENEMMDWLDGYAKGTLSAENQHEMERRIASDPVFREQAEEHVRLVKAMAFKHDRDALKRQLEVFHTEVADERPDVQLPVKVKSTPGFLRRYLPLTAVAASVALISVLGTLLILQGLETKQTAYYKELRRNVDQIKKSQNLIMQGMAESKEKKSSTLTIYAGTGFLISSNGYIATSHHVVKDADSVYIENEKYGQMKAAVYYSDPTNDVAILKITNHDFNPGRLPFTILNDESDLGEYACTLGYPREDIVFGEGSVSASTGFRQNENAYQVSVPVNPGNSGGPLLNDRGDIIGMISGIQTETSGATFAIKSTVLLSVVKAVPTDSIEEPILLPRQSNLRKLERVEQIKKWKEMVFMVRVYNN